MSESRPNEEPTDREMILFEATLCEETQRYEDMVDVMRSLCGQYDDLTIEERNLLSVAYKNVIGSRRMSHWVLHEILRSQDPNAEQSNHAIGNHAFKECTNNQASAKETTYNLAVIREVSQAIETEMRDYCCNIIDILDTRLIPSTTSTCEAKVFYYKMKGDFSRYLCEICSGQERKEKSNESLLAYKTACDKAIIELPPTNPIRLSLMLNFAVFYHDIMKSPERSCRLAEQAFDDAIAELDTMREECYLHSTAILRLLRDNMEIWKRQLSENS